MAGIGIGLDTAITVRAIIGVMDTTARERTGATGPPITAMAIARSGRDSISASEPTAEVAPKGGYLNVSASPA